MHFLHFQMLWTSFVSLWHIGVLPFVCLSCFFFTFFNDPIDRCTTQIQLTTSPPDPMAPNPKVENVKNFQSPIFRCLCCLCFWGRVTTRPDLGAKHSWYLKAACWKMNNFNFFQRWHFFKIGEGYMYIYPPGNAPGVAHLTQLQMEDMYIYNT